MEKNFLESLVDENKPESFQEEKRIKIVKDKKPLNLKLIVFLGGVFVLLSVLGYFLFLAPKIMMEDFVGRNKNELFAFLRQEGIEVSKVVIKEEFNFDYDKDVVVSQNVRAGQKIKKDSKLNFEISKGADPDEKINLPDLKKMTKTQINTWIKDNKLSNVRVNIVYDDKVAIDEVIKVEVKDDDFKRSSSANIQISKGKAPASDVVIPDFKGHNIDSYEKLLKSKKIEVLKIASFSNDPKLQENNSIISVVPDINTTIKQGETVTVYYSKGRSIKVLDFTKMSKEKFDNWRSKNPGVNLSLIEKYTDQSAYILSQNISPDTQIDAETEIVLTINLGKPNLRNFNEGRVIGANFSALIDWVNSINSKGYDVFAGNWNVEPLFIKGYKKGQILSISCNIHQEDIDIDCYDDLPYKARINVTVSAGEIYEIDTANLKLIDLPSELSKLNIKFSSSQNDLSLIKSFKIKGVASSQPYTDNFMTLEDVNDQLVIYEGSEVEFR